ncbi:MAG TPA: cytochrome c [Acetobacteraceae bacterium]|nr:cytochrome c [Acetobacteraceae bacterium]
MTKKLALGLVIALAAVGAARADGYDPIETRQAGQDLLAGDFAGIRAVVAAKGDVTKLADPAKAMARWITQFPSQFPPGSDKGHNTKALPAIWSDPAGFKKAASDLATAADKLAQLAKAGDAEAMGPQLKVVADACVACHRTYRAK